MELKKIKALKLEKLLLGNNTLAFLLDFNANLLKYNIYTDISNFLNSIYSSFLLLHITIPCSTTAATAAIIDNIFTNNCNSPYASSNLVITLSDHHAQSLIIKNQLKLSENKKEDQLYRDFQGIEKKLQYLKTCKMYTGKPSSA